MGGKKLGMVQIHLYSQQWEFLNLNLAVAAHGFYLSKKFYVSKKTPTNAF